MGTDALRTCNVCKKEAHNEEELELFTKQKDCKYGRKNLCKPCQLERNRRQPSHKIKRWKTDHQVRTRYGCDVATYEARMASSTCCQICSKTEDLVYDHCHDTMEFRGVLCRGCNRSIGQLGDTLESLQRAVNYLKSNYSGE